jgi:hypothetical protein
MTLDKPYPQPTYSTRKYTRHYKRLLLVFLYVSSAEGKAKCPEHVDKHLATEIIYPQSSDEKLHLNSATTYSCLKIENAQDDRLQIIKTLNQYHGLRCTKANAKT